MKKDEKRGKIREEYERGKSRELGKKNKSALFSLQNWQRKSPKLAKQSGQYTKPIL